jgi:2,4-dienoyl-CoA reductase (NADPH2)
MQSLFSPIKIGTLELPNRIVMPAMHLNYTMDGKVSQQLIDFYVARARGGVGLAIVGGMPTCQPAGPFFMPLIKSDEFLPGLTQLADAVHAAGGKVGVQLYDAGAYAHQMSTGVEARSASAHTSKFTRELCHEMSQEEIDEAIQAFADGAERAKRAGFDMVEVVGSAGYLICQFLSPKINQRTDRYGGSMDNRMRFGLEVLEAVRKAVGPDFPVGIRLAGNDFVPGSHTNAESRVFAAAVQQWVDLINVTGGWHECTVPQLTSDLPRGAWHYLARGIKEAVDVPVAASNRLGDPVQAEHFVQNGFADLICMGRPLIADPDLPNKAAAGELDAIRPCTSCNQSCFDHVMKMMPITCMVNPIAGHEGERAVTPAETPRKVMVVGAGVAGLEAAVTARLRGHDVEIHEQGDRLGGQVEWAAEPTFKPEFPTLLDYYRGRIEALGISVHLGSEVTPARVEASDADVILVATGARPLEVPIPGCDRPEVVQAWDVLRGRAPVGDKVVIVGGGSVGCETALWLAKVGTLTPEELYFHTLWGSETPEVLQELLFRGSKDVTVVEVYYKLGKDLGSRRWIVSTKLKKMDVHTHVKTEVVEISDRGVVCKGPDGEEIVLPADTVVLALGSAPDDALLQTLRDEVGDGREIVGIGDCTKPKKIPEAIEAGFLAACAL